MHRLIYAWIERSVPIICACVPTLVEWSTCCRVRKYEQQVGGVVWLVRDVDNVEEMQCVFGVRWDLQSEDVTD